MCGEEGWRDVALSGCLGGCYRNLDWEGDDGCLCGTERRYICKVHWRGLFAWNGRETKCTTHWY